MRIASTALAAVAAALAACTEAQPCPSPLVECGGVCVDVQQEIEHCGACGEACVSGQACLEGICTASEDLPCDRRTGGAFVLLAASGQSVKAWIADPVFVETAEDLAAGMGAAAPYPVLDVRAGTDCDGQWTWHVDPGTARFLATLPAGCGGSPGELEAAGASRIGDPWCPDPALFLLVERRD